MSNLELTIQSRERDLGGFFVRRVLPYATHRMVGPFIFFDHIGPADFAPGKGMEVRPHPHINLATVTYLFDGKVHHRDSLGSDRVIEPGAINWMTAGRGIVHSERTPEDLVATGGRIHGIQCWVALPDDKEEIDPDFRHHPKDTLPEFAIGPAKAKLLVGKAVGYESPVKVHSDMFYLEVKLPENQNFSFPTEDREGAFYVVDGAVEFETKTFETFEMGVVTSGATINLKSTKPTTLMLLGGKPVGDRHIYWNFVSSSKETIEAAKAEWSLGGPRKDSRKFQPIPGDDKEYIPLPVEEPRIVRKGTIM